MKKPTIRMRRENTLGNRCKRIKYLSIVLDSKGVERMSRRFPANFYSLGESLCGATVSNAFEVGETEFLV